jgi:hypothetical protein
LNYGIYSSGNATGADTGGMYLTGGTTGGEGLECVATGNGHGIYTVGAGTGEGLHATAGGGANAHGAHFEGVGANSSGLYLSRGGSGGDDLKFANNDVTVANVTLVATTTLATTTTTLTNPVTLANGAHGGAGATITLQTPIAATVPDTQKVDVNTIKTQAVTCAAAVTVLASVGTASTSIAQTGDGYAIVNNVTYGLSALKTLIDDVPTVTEFNARTLVSADYFVVTDYTAPPTTGQIITAMGTGSFLSAIPWNASWDAEVQSECADAITAAGLVAGGDATAANQATIIAALTAIKGTGWTTETLKAIKDQLALVAVDAAAASGGSVGTGEFAINHNSGGTNALAALTAGAAGIAGITVKAYLTTDYTAGSQSAEYVRGTATTNDAGGWIHSLMLNAGTYTIRYDDPTGAYATTTKSLTVSATGTASVT